MKNKTSNNDQIIIQKIREGDTSLFRELIERYKDVSFSLACSIVKNEQDAEDVLQDAFVKAFRNLNKFKRKSSFATWLYRIVVNTCYTFVNKRTKRPEGEWNEQETNSNHLDHQTGFSSLADTQQQEIIRTALKKMKQDEALLLQLYYLSEQGIKEIQQITGFGESKIKVTLHRARISIHEQLQILLGQEIHNLL